MKLYKFRPLVSCKNYERIISIFDDGFHCCDFLEFNDVNEGVYPISEQTRIINLDSKLEHRICSFSKKKALKSQLMWGHYANVGMGVAIETDVGNCSQIKKVHYGKKNRHHDITEILTNKSREWKHEKECRYISTDPSEYFKFKISKVYFGTPYKHLVNYAEIIEKHTKLKDFIKYSEQLNEICSVKGIACENYSFR